MQMPATTHYRRLRRRSSRRRRRSRRRRHVRLTGTTILMATSPSKRCGVNSQISTLLGTTPRTASLMLILFTLRPRWPPSLAAVSILLLPLLSIYAVRVAMSLVTLTVFFEPTQADVSVQIGDHVREDNKMLNGMDQFDTSGSMLGGTVKRPTALANSRDGWHTAYLAIFCGPRVSLHLPDDAIASNSTFSSRCFPPRAVTNANTTQPSGTKRWTVWGTCPRPVAHVCWGLSTRVRSRVCVSAHLL